LVPPPFARPVCIEVGTSDNGFFLFVVEDVPSLHSIEQSVDTAVMFLVWIDKGILVRSRLSSLSTAREAVISGGSYGRSTMSGSSTVCSSVLVSFLVVETVHHTLFIRRFNLDVLLYTSSGEAMRCDLIRIGQM
jgi:hypothetical protein